MSTLLIMKIRNFLNDNGLAVAAFERKAGLKINVARNILKGQSKKPSGETLQAIANVMDCSIKELLDNELGKNERICSKIEHPKLLLETLHFILERDSYDLTLNQALTALEEAYHYSIKKGCPKVDPEFINWYLDRTGIRKIS
ncbi:MAG: helix-turn-helix transcriptional regulator [Alphaproteobacteria bacterium]|jgi:transcriptional regulator with XRE-family HTH domain|nr:helix-turn-helix transcriptional regulator [Alphaproteobacteria bacterium]